MYEFFIRSCSSTMLLVDEEYNILLTNPHEKIQKDLNGIIKGAMRLVHHSSPKFLLKNCRKPIAK